MTTPTLIEAARAALDALGSLIDAQNGPPLVRHAASWLCAMNGASAAMQALRAAIEAAEKAKPVGMLHVSHYKSLENREFDYWGDLPDGHHSLYAALPAQQPARAKQDAEMPRPLADWHEDDGAVVWWRFLVDEPAWIGTPLDDDWPGYHTHWTPHPPVPEVAR